MYYALNMWNHTEADPERYREYLRVAEPCLKDVGGKLLCLGRIEPIPQQFPWRHAWRRPALDEHHDLRNLRWAKAALRASDLSESLSSSGRRDERVCLGLL
jgi:hypothetical protein